jgi:hypothetical protein
MHQSLEVLYKLCVFYVDRNSKMITTAGYSFYIGPIGFFLQPGERYRLLRASGYYISFKQGQARNVHVSTIVKFILMYY